MLGAQRRITAEADGRQQRRARADNALRAGVVVDLRADDGSVLGQQSLRRPSGEQLAMLADQPLARQQIVGHVGLGSLPVPEDCDRVGDMGAK